MVSLILGLGGRHEVEFVQYYSQTRFLGFVPKIKQNLKDWQIVDVSLTGKTAHNLPYIARKLKEYFGDRDGIIFLCSRTEMIVLVNMGPAADVSALTTGITEKMPKYSCVVEASDITAEGLLKFQLRLGESDEEKKEPGKPGILMAARQNRPENIVMVADDDMFMRSLIKKNFKDRATVIEHGDIANLVDSYLEILPDILFLDIHLPGGSGVDILSEIISFDDSAYAIIMSSDSVKDNVLEARKYGAKGFMAKPFTPEKLEACFQKCPTVKMLKKSEG